MKKKRTIARSQGFYVYIVSCREGTLYTGYTVDVEKRVALHNEGKGAKCLRGKLPVQLVYAKHYRYLRSALLNERKIKKMPRREKLAFIALSASKKTQ